jgi:aryl-alcohol dehydrogenase-like predicted oxidoreductase
LFELTEESIQSMAVERLPRRKLGRTDLDVTAIALGGGGIGGLRTTDSDDAGRATVVRALERGINHVDTAPGYLQSERRVGLAVRRLGGLPTGVHLSTKTPVYLGADGLHDAEQTSRSIDQSLQLLGVRSVDIVLVHAPGSMEPVMARGGVLEELERQRGLGKFRWIGIGERDHEVLRVAIRSGRFDVILTFADYNLVRQTGAALIDEAADAGVGVMLAQVLLFGLLAGPEPAAGPYAAHPRSHYLVADVPAAHGWWAWARERQVSLRALALQYATRHARVGTVIVGADRPEHVDEIVDSVQERIPDEVWTEVDDRIAMQSR